MGKNHKNVSCLICKKPESKFFCNKNGYDLYKCLHCGHIFVYNFLAIPDDLYDEDYFKGAKKGSGYVDYDIDKEPMRKSFVKYLKLIDKYISEKGRLLDIGAATGYFMEIANKFGWATHGIEISKYASEIASNKGLRVDYGTLSTVEFSHESFDCVTMLDLLEHLPNPNLDINKIRLLLKERGLLVINTPDSGSLFARIMDKKWHLLVPPEHLNYFSRKSIMMMLEKNGFKVQYISTIGKTFTLQYIINFCTSKIGINFLQKVLMFLITRLNIHMVSVYINLHDNMFIIARKISK